ncbi:MAG: GMC family oxidoreductase [Sandaracinaceae bacterium]|nr:GMC family oxidoreductase [Sandaracinaceae bacterium]
MIYDAAALPHPLVLEADVCVVGSGAGGGTAAMVAAEAGLRVVVLEAGAFVPPEAMTQREEQMIPALLWDHGGRTTADRAVAIHQGRAVGGSTVHNLNLIKRVPDAILEAWRRERGLSHLSLARWHALYDEAEALLGVTDVPEALVSRHNRVLRDGAEALGWRGGRLRHNRAGCQTSGFCLLGCAYDAKNNVPRVVLPRAVRAGATVLSNAQAVRVEQDDGRARAVVARAIDPVTRVTRGRVEIRARHVCLSASATGTAALLARSEVPDPSGTTGRGLRVHPALVVAGEMRDEVRAWQGVPQSYECTEHLTLTGTARPPLGTRTWIVPAFAHPIGTATMLPGLGAEHRRLMRLYPRLAVLTAMIHDETAGRVRPSGELGVELDYWPDAADRAELLFGLEACARLLFAAGARRVFVPTHPVTELSPSDPFPRFALERGSMPVTAVHPMASVPMGDDPRASAVGSDGAHHHVDGLWVADGSLFPTSIGVPPQLSIYAMGLHVGRAIAGRGARGRA